jgi:hypothetical protein
MFKTIFQAYPDWNILSLINVNLSEKYSLQSMIGSTQFYNLDPIVASGKRLPATVLMEELLQLLIYASTELIDFTQDFGQLQFLRAVLEIVCRFTGCAPEREFILVHIQAANAFLQSTHTPAFE